jgi:hypothetical protein
LASPRAWAALGTKQTSTSYINGFTESTVTGWILWSCADIFFDCIAQIFSIFTVKLGIKITFLRRFCDVWNWKMRHIQKRNLTFTDYVKSCKHNLVILKTEGYRPIGGLRFCGRYIVRMLLTVR